MNETNTRIPAHLWVVGALSLLWNAVGAFDYTATQMRLESYMSQFTPQQLDYPWRSAECCAERNRCGGTSVQN
jgi:hypothetical protein